MEKLPTCTAVTIHAEENNANSLFAKCTSDVSVSNDISDLQSAKCRNPRYIAVKVGHVHTTWDKPALCDLQNALKRVLSTVVNVIEDPRAEF